jgi:hypothetical protein
VIEPRGRMVAVADTALVMLRHSAVIVPVAAESGVGGRDHIGWPRLQYTRTLLEILCNVLNETCTDWPLRE